MSCCSRMDAMIADNCYRHDCGPHQMEHLIATLFVTFLAGFTSFHILGFAT